MWIAMEIAPMIRTKSSAIETLGEEKIRFSDFVSTIRLELSLIEQQGKTRVLHFWTPLDNLLDRLVHPQKQKRHTKSKDFPTQVL